MALPRAPRRPAFAVALVLLAGLLPAGPAQAASTDSPKLQVSPEIGISTQASAPFTATVYGSHAATTVTFHVIDGVAQGVSDQTCVAPANDTASSCSVSITSNSQGTSQVRAWIGSSPDLTEGRLSSAKATPSGLLGGLTSDPDADCQPADNPSGGGGLDLGGLFGGGGQADICHTAKNPATGQPDPETPGTTAEGDGTDVVRMTWQSFTEGRLDCADSLGGDVRFKNAGLTQQTEQYNCQLSSDEGAPISGAFIDEKVVGGVDANSSSAPDKDNACQTGSDGRCTTPISLSMTQKGYDLICFWAEPPPGNNVYGTNSTNDGKDCSQLKADSPLRNDITDVVYLDYNDPRAEGLDVQPEAAVVAGATRFSLRAVVYDQFGQPFKGNTALQAKLFPGSVLVGAGDSDVSKLDPNLTCNTGGAESCVILTAAQNDLGTNLACVWISTAKAPTAMTGGADQESSTCTTHQEVWQEAGDQEPHLDPTADDGPPSPPTDGLDVVRFSEQSRPKISTTSPKELRQATNGAVLAVDGINFLASARISVSGTGVALGPTAVVSDKHLEASLAVASDAPPGARDITVTNVSDGGSFTCSGCFRVIGQGYWMVATDGGLFSFGDARFAGSAAGQASKPVVAMTATATGNGYWMVASDGGIFAFGDAPFLGSTGGLSLSKPIVSMAATPSGQGYWLVATDGGVFGFGDAKFHGALSRLTLAKPIVSIVATPSGRGYWLLASDGGIFAFGDAGFYGSTGDLILNKPIVAMAPTKTGKGYWLVGSDGGIFAYGDAVFYGSTGSLALNKPIVGMTTTPFGKGYWMVATDGGIFSFGDAQFLGSTGDIKLNKPIVGIARR